MGGVPSYALFTETILKPKHSLSTWTPPPWGGPGSVVTVNKEIFEVVTVNKGFKPILVWV